MVNTNRIDGQHYYGVDYSGRGRLPHTAAHNYGVRAASNAHYVRYNQQNGLNALRNSDLQITPEQAIDRRNGQGTFDYFSNTRGFADAEFGAFNPDERGQADLQRLAQAFEGDEDFARRYLYAVDMNGDGKVDSREHQAFIVAMDASDGFDGILSKQGRDRFWNAVIENPQGVRQYVQQAHQYIQRAEQFVVSSNQEAKNTRGPDSRWGNPTGLRPGEQPAFEPPIYAAANAGTSGPDMRIQPGEALNFQI